MDTIAHEILRTFVGGRISLSCKRLRRRKLTERRRQKKPGVGAHVRTHEVGKMNGDKRMRGQRSGCAFVRSPAVRAAPFASPSFCPLLSVSSSALPSVLQETEMSPRRGVSTVPRAPREPAARAYQRPQQCLNFLPLRQGQGSLRPTLGPVRMGLALSACAAAAASLTMSAAFCLSCSGGVPKALAS